MVWLGGEGTYVPPKFHSPFQRGVCIAGAARLGEPPPTRGPRFSGAEMAWGETDCDHDFVIGDDMDETLLCLTSAQIRCIVWG